MAARLEQNAKRRAEEKSASVGKTTPPGSAQDIEEEIRLIEAEYLLAATLTPVEARGGLIREIIHAYSYLNPPSRLESGCANLWDEAVESLGRSAGVLEELAESTGEAIARIAARGDRIDRIQKETRTLLNALVASETDA